MTLCVAPLYCVLCHLVSHISQVTTRAGLLNPDEPLCPLSVSHWERSDHYTGLNPGCTDFLPGTIFPMTGAPDVGHESNRGKFHLHSSLLLLGFCTLLPAKMNRMYLRNVRFKNLEKYKNFLLFSYLSSLQLLLTCCDSEVYFVKTVLLKIYHLC